MKSLLRTSAVVLGGCVGVASAAGNPPPLDRPTPPPCCADGKCYTNPVTWGHYQTRWRRWPTDYLEPLPPGARPPAALEPDIPPYEVPPAEEEDRRPPPPTAPRRDPDAEMEGPPAAPPGPNGEAPAARPVMPPSRPPGMPLGPPSDRSFGQPDIEEDSPASTLPMAPPPTTLPFNGEPPSTLPFGEPMGDADPPPAPPFRLSEKSRSATGPAALPAPQTAPRSQPSAKPDNDPPPALPIAVSY